MIPEIGHFALILALGVTLVQGTLPLVGAARGIPEWTAIAVPAARAQLLFVVIAYGCLTYAFITNDFSVAYVAQNSNTAQPLVYQISGVWGAHEGSLLLWALFLAVWTVAVTVFSRVLPVTYTARVVAVLGLVSVGFYLFMLATSNPFDRLLPAPAEGRELNPLLQDPGLAIHPPMLYLGYVGLSVPFAFAIAALLDGRLDAAWVRWTRPWTVIAWVFLTLGIALGSWWAYYELGWGGWWFWDPVENASFMPWLVATALIHSLAVTEKRGAFKAWTVLLSIFAFSMSLLGTFLVRSGVLVSVHAFATDPARGLFILIFLGLVVGGSLMLYAWRAGTVSGGGSFELFSRETLLLVNNVLLVGAAAAILIGTLYPLFLDALNLGKISVGPPYFDPVFILLMLPLMLAMGVGILARWRKDRLEAYWQRFPLPKHLLAVVMLALLLVTALVMLWLMVHIVKIAPPAPTTLMVTVGMAMVAWITFTSLVAILDRLKKKANPWKAVLGLPRGFFGMTFAHVGVAVFTVGVTLTTAYSVEKDLRMSPGDVFPLADYSFRFEGVGPAQGPNYRAQRGTVRVFRDDSEVTVLYPEKRFYSSQPNNAMTEAAINAGLTRDLYVSLGEPIPGTADWSVRLYHKPFVQWIWLGCVFMGIGGILAATDRRYRMASKVKRDSAAATTGPAPALESKA
ncbi:MAG: heme lyase CcmF/NrfE family subunit [Gammaproteobacteria bacterium]|nr:heme lyase CcmF/NrfE family subunit [Gammaproteobacteria bacterium]MDJ0892214.1 heme lyase CcmF/NrfE family subunit [Gammaproteobacteria bacterium]